MTQLPLVSFTICGIAPLDELLPGVKINPAIDCQGELLSLFSNLTQGKSKARGEEGVTGFITSVG
jgi:hypothetical protein